jgi:hypothetical protein
MTRIIRGAVTLAVLAMAACGDGNPGGGPGPGGVSRAKQVSAVTAAEKEMLCDWFVGMVGGYGAAPTCGDGFIQAPPDKPECVATFPVCSVTVGQLQDCMETILDAQEICTEASLTAAMADANCQTVGASGCFD